MRYVLGIDAGGTKTVALLASEDGTPAGEARGAGCHLLTHGEIQLEKVLSALLEQAAGGRTVSALCVGLAGVRGPRDEAVVRNVLRRIGYREGARTVSDAMVALVAGAPERVGIALLAGTGAVAFGLDGGGQSARSGGHGPMLSDEGSGSWLGLAALRAVVRASDGRGPETALTALALASLGVASVADLLPLVHEKGLPRFQIAALAGVVEKAKDRGDAVAAGLLDGAAGELVRHVRAVGASLAFRDGPFPVVLGGGLFKACPALVALVSSRLDLPGARPFLLEVEPALGAVALARELLAS